MIAKVAAYVDRDRQELVAPGLGFACSRDGFRPAPEPAGVVISVVERGEMADVYCHTGFPHALSYRLDHPRPDMVAALARRDGRVIGIAAASADAERLWQIGVDVVASERRAGIGRALVSRVTSYVLELGKVPYYSAAVSNIASRSLAIGLGYWPAWTEIFVRDRNDAIPEREVSG